MRYQNWDILLFPDGSKIPIQEFKTTCYVTPSESPFPQNPSFINTTYPTEGGSLSQLPVLTAFVGSLRTGEAFRVSVHCWQRPTPSRALQSCMMTDDTPMFEARVYVDGLLTVNHVFDSRTIWPVVLDTNTRLEREGRVENLRFPPFHQAILRQDHWDAGEAFGRIRVVIAEGLAREFSAHLPEEDGFDRFRDLVAFSFQHAPPSILEFSGIAWPNAGMWNHGQRTTGRPTPIGIRIPTTLDHDAHAHSPRRPLLSSQVSQSTTCPNDPIDCAARQCPHPIHFAALQSNTPPMYQGSWVRPSAGPSNAAHHSMLTCDDPFMGPPPAPSSAKRWSHVPKNSTSHDLPMPDYVSSKSEHSRAYTDMSGVSYPTKDFERTMNEVAIEEIVKALSPIRKDELIEALRPERGSGSGTHPPVNTPSSLLTPGKQLSPSVNSYLGAYRPGNIEDLSLDVNSGVQLHSTLSIKGSNTSRSVRCSVSPGSSVQSRKELANSKSDENGALNVLIREAQNQAAFTTNAALHSLEPSAERSVVNCNRAASNASKRKRSISKRKQDDNGKASPSVNKTTYLDLNASVHSPHRENDTSPQEGGVALEA